MSPFPYASIIRIRLEGLISAPKTAGHPLTCILQIVGKGNAKVLINQNFRIFIYIFLVYGLLFDWIGLYFEFKKVPLRNATF